MQLKLEQQEKESALREAQLTHDSLAAEKARVNSAFPHSRLFETLLSRPLTAVLQTTYFVNSHIVSCIGGRIAKFFEMIPL